MHVVSFGNAQGNPWNRGMHYVCYRDILVFGACGMHVVRAGTDLRCRKYLSNRLCVPGRVVWIIL